MDFALRRTAGPTLPLASDTAPPSRVCVARAPDHRHELDKGAILAFELPLGIELACLQGTLWITHDRDTRDVVLEAGTHYLPDRPSRMLVQALEAAQVRVSRRAIAR